jgi:predicted ATPase/class 3 adenylate cyclase
VAELPTGTVTFVFTDLEGSTRRWEEHPDAMKLALARHDAILGEAVASHGGRIVKSTGDGIHAVFASPLEAVAACLEGQRELADEPWPEPPGSLRVRMGVHAGEAQLRDGDYYGSVLNRAARFTAIGHGGQVLVSDSVEPLVRGALPKDAALVDLGMHRLRDLAHPIGVFQLTHPDLLRDFPPLRSLDALPGNLPLQVSSFIGRDREFARVIAALEEARVVTLTGVGGVGKTRLALQVAAEVVPRFREGAWLIELAAVRDPDAVSDAFATVFAVTPSAGQSVEAALIEFLRTKQLLLVVDNCEHLLESAAGLIELLERSCSGLMVLATSREGLALDGERMVAVPSLAAPPPDAPIDELAGADAVQLFIERAGAVDADFALDAQNAPAVASVCRRLDGVPLAIELAAARVTAMSPAELASGLDRRFEMLAGGRRRAVQRHQTLRAAIDWSYELLSAPEQRLLARLAVFAGGATRDAIEAVCAGEPIEPREVFELLIGLVDRSLVVAQRDAPTTRYRLLETIREYGEERLAEHGETHVLRARHAEYYVDVVAKISEEVHGRHQKEAGRQLSVEHENVLGAANFAIDTDDADLGLRLVRNTPAWGWQIGYELRVPVDAILGLTGASQHPLYPYGLALAALYAGTRGDAVATKRLSDRALGTVPDFASDPVISFVVAGARGALAFSIGDWDELINLEETAAREAQVAGMRADSANALAAAALGHTMAGDTDAAAPLAGEALAIARDVGAPTLIAGALSALAGAIADRDPQRAQALLHENRQLRATLGFENANEITSAVLINARMRDWVHTLELAASSIRHLHWRGDVLYLAGIFNIVARSLATTDPDSAAFLQGAAHRLTATRMAELRAAQLAGTTTTTPTGTGDANQRTGTSGLIADLRREATAILRKELGQERLNQLRAQGSTANTDDAVARALTSINKALATVDDQPATMAPHASGDRP